MFINFILEAIMDSIVLTILFIIALIAFALFCIYTPMWIVKTLGVICILLVCLMIISLFPGGWRLITHFRK